jgi:hypothetical protein
VTPYEVVIVNDKMQKGYRYELMEPMGSNFHPGFQPELTPGRCCALLMTRAAGSNGIAGRRMPEEDQMQIKYWRAMWRHMREIKRHCTPGDLGCRRRQCQTLLHWAYDSAPI